MKNYVKAALYAYPFLKNVGREYAEHIENKAILSYRSGYTAERLALYLAEEILQKEKLEWLKERIERVLGKLSEVERTLVAIRYFGKERKIKRELADRKRNGEKYANVWSERKYFRRQNRLSEKVGAMLEGVGVTQEVFEREYAGLDIFKKIYKFVCEGRDRGISKNERQWLRVERGDL